MVGATALQIAAPSIAEKMGIPYVFAAYCPTVLPSPHHAPPVLAMLGDTPAPPSGDYTGLWVQDARRWNESWGSLLNSHRATLGLASVDDVRSHVLTDRPWLAADATLAPWPDPAEQAVLQTGAWILPDANPLSPELEAFLDAGEPPVYFGFGSNRATEDLSRVMIQTARALGRRAIVSRGWADLSLVDDEPDCLAVGEVNQQAAVQASRRRRPPRRRGHDHRGREGPARRRSSSRSTTTSITGHTASTTSASEPRTHPAHRPADSLTSALEHTLEPDVAARAKSIAAAMRRDGALTAARRLIATGALEVLTRKTCTERGRFFGQDRPRVTQSALLRKSIVTPARPHGFGTIVQSAHSLASNTAAAIPAPHVPSTRCD